MREMDFEPSGKFENITMESTGMKLLPLDLSQMLSPRLLRGESVSQILRK